MSTIICRDMADFIAVCAGLAREGVIFKADATLLCVTLTGGF